MSLEGLDVAVVVFLVNQMYDGVTQKEDQGVTQRRCDCYVLHMGMLFPRIVSNFGNLDVRYRSCSKTCVTGLSVVRATMFMVRRGGSRQCGNDNIDRPSNFLHDDS